MSFEILVDQALNISNTYIEYAVIHHRSGKLHGYAGS